MKMQIDKMMVKIFKGLKFINLEQKRFIQSRERLRPAASLYDEKTSNSIKTADPYDTKLL